MSQSWERTTLIRSKSILNSTALTHRVFATEIFSKILVANTNAPKIGVKVENTRQFSVCWPLGQMEPALSSGALGFAIGWLVLSEWANEETPIYQKPWLLRHSCNPILLFHWQAAACHRLRLYQDYELDLFFGNTPPHSTTFAEWTLSGLNRLEQRHSTD